MNRLIIIIFLLSIISCNPERNIEKIEYEFYPAFLSPIKYSIDLNDKVLYQNSKFHKSNGTIQGSKNLINKKYDISNENLALFLNEIREIGLDSSIVHQRNVLDGIGFKFNTIDQRNDTISLTSVSPSRIEEYELDYKILDAFFQLANKTINDYKALSITENIQDYFAYGLPIKLTNNEPLEYRIWGGISGCESDNPELIRFLDSLPNDKPVIFDLRNGSFAPCLSSLLDRFNKTNQFFYYGNYYLTNSDLELETLKDQLKEVEKDSNSSMVGSLRVRIRETEKFKKEIENEIVKNQNTFGTKEEIIKTIANNGYK
ncbi:hypothetical protein [uncultured Psychroserpens sp.]|uniref:hypothetical protein n=1 Tax=uncultured Psychroserpens sp. TaxID=255436 RepID=UPI00262FD0A9|nr:hypothetical protein [uncultured Psychroserpens sp.]